MDRIALRKLVDSGVERARAYWHDQSGEADSASGLELVLDRLTQTGQIALTYEEPWLLREVLRGLLEIYRIALPENRDAWKPREPEARWLFKVGSRAWILGADATRRGRFDIIPDIVLQRPIEEWPTQYWLRYTVTMAARGEINVFRGKSLIGPISESVREKPQIFATFSSNLDQTVNALSQFDFLACVLVITQTKSLDGIYPNFGGYYGDRTMPIVENLVEGGTSRAALPDVDDALLAETLHKLDVKTKNAFFEVNGWRGYSKDVREYIRKHGGDKHGDE